jgi:Rps23 Pro-64 3,4-dihydroxylase Tpa1-like proline 4-hydroxylase
MAVMFALCEIYREKTYENIAMISLATAFFCALGMIKMLSKVNIIDEKAKPFDYSMKYKSYEEFYHDFSSTILLSHYNEVGNLDNDDRKLTIFSQEKHYHTIYISIIYQTEFTDEVYNSYIDDIEAFVLNKEQNDSKDLYLLNCICVDKNSKEFVKLIHSNTYQSMKRYQINIGVRFSDKKLFIANQKGGMFKNKYKYLKNESISILKNMIDP